MSRDGYGNNMKTFKGYVYLLRTNMFLIRDLKIDFSIYGFYIVLLQLADWDSKRKTFGYVKQNGTEIAKILNISEYKVSRYKKSLRRYGLIKDTDIGVQLTEYARCTKEVATYLSKLIINNRDEDIANLQNMIAIPQGQVAELQNIEPDKISPFNSSFKVSNLEDDYSEIEQSLRESGV